MEADLTVLPCPSRCAIKVSCNPPAHSVLLHVQIHSGRQGSYMRRQLVEVPFLLLVVQQYYIGK
jgi:hypothetical protein